eukprot:gene2737-7990_t
MGYYSQGQKLVDQTCGEMARYAARFVGWYTAGGFADECGTRHESGLHYNWTYLSVLNENEHGMVPSGGVEYTACFDAWRAEIAKVNPRVKLIGPEFVSDDAPSQPMVVAEYLMDARNHADKQPPAV